MRRWVSALGVSIVLLAAHGAAAGGALPSCDAGDRMLVESVLASGGTLDLACSGTIEIDATLVAEGVTATIRGNDVSIARDPLGPPFRILEVRGSTLTLDGIDLVGGQAFGAPGGDGADGVDGNGRPGGANGGNGQSGTDGETGFDATPAEDGAAGEDGRGAAMWIDGTSTVVLRNCFVGSNSAAGGPGGDGGLGGRGGTGGAGGNGGGGPGIDAGNGARGGDGGQATPGGDGGAGGNAQGGAIDNAGSLTVRGCTFQSNGASGGIGGRGAFGGTGGAGTGGGAGGASYNTDPLFPTVHTGLGGRGGDGGNGAPGKDGGDGGDGGSALGGCIHNTGTLVVRDTHFQNCGAFGVAAGLGASAGAGGGGGSGGNAGSGKPGGNGGNGGNGGDGAVGGTNGNGGGAVGGAIYSTTPVTLTGVTFQANSVGGGSGGLNNCTPGDFSCFGAGGDAGALGTRGLGGQNQPLGSGFAPNGSDGIAGAPGTDGTSGATSFGLDANCRAAGQACVVPEPGALALGGAALAACAAVARRRGASRA